MMGGGKEFGIPIYTYRNFRRREGLTVEKVPSGFGVMDRSVRREDCQ